MNKQQREEILKNDLSGLKVGDEVWSSGHGRAKVLDTAKSGPYPILIDYLSGRGHVMSDGKSTLVNEHPAIFKSLDHCIAYFQALKEQEEEAAVWTWEKIVRCSKIKQGTPFSNHYYTDVEQAFVSHINTIGLHFISREWTTSIGIYDPNAKYAEFEFYDRHGDPLNPRDY